MRTSVVNSTVFGCADSNWAIADCVMPSGSANCTWDNPRDSRSATKILRHIDGRQLFLDLRVEDW